MLKLLLKWLLSACALLAVAYLYSGVQVSGFGAAMWAALFIGLLNA
ncbi:MAG: phage holin family protein, partial [Betaproteobacteria bacterium]|nr:phage holin family protein [Betaproteobacteria bacterium]